MKKNVILLIILLGLILILPFLFGNRCALPTDSAAAPAVLMPSPSMPIISIQITESSGSGTFPVTPEPTPVSTEPGTTSFISWFLTPAPKTTTVPTAVAPSVKPESAFSITIDGQTIQILATLDEKALEKSPGWLINSAKPGEEGVCVIYGHRNRNHLKVLKNVSYGDPITVAMPDGKQYIYTVESTEILESEEALRIPTISGKHLMLTTCYPFYYTGHAPKKYIVLASLTQSEN